MTSFVHSIYRKLVYGQPVVVVSGLPRSGTSMAMKMLDAGGMNIVTDEQRKADEDNPKGYFELEKIKDLEKDADKSWLVDARGKAIKVISFLLKELPATNNYRVLFMNRNLDEILASQAKMLDRRGESSETSDDKMKELWEDHLWKIKYRVKRQSHFELIELHYKEVLGNPAVQAQRIRDFTDLDLDVEKMAGVVDKQLYRNRR